MPPEEVTVLMMRVMGATLCALALGHVALPRLLRFERWGSSASASELKVRVDYVHTFFIGLGLLGHGLLFLLVAPELLTSNIGHMLLGGCALGWALRLLAQWLVFDPVLPSYRTPLRIVATVAWASFLFVAVAALHVTLARGH